MNALRRYTPSRAWRTRIQSRMPSGSAPELAPRGLLVRGVVLNTYETDSPQHPATAGSYVSQPIGIYCDVLVYSSVPAIHNAVLRNVPVKQEACGMHDGQIWKPRPTGQTVAEGLPIEPNGGGSPADMEGDHVLVGFLDGSLVQPVILGAIAHPATDTGDVGSPTGHHLKLKLADGAPWLRRHHGVVLGADTNGNVVVDATRAHNGTYTAGAEPPPNEADATVGAVNVRLLRGKALSIAVVAGVGTPTEQSVATLEFRDGQLLVALNQLPELKVEPTGVLTIGTGVLHAAIGEKVQEYLVAHEAAAGAFNAHTHNVTAVGSPTGPPVPTYAAPGTPDRVVSAKVAIEG